MTGLKVYLDLMSQPCRALALFLQLNKIPHEVKMVQIKKGEHLDPEYIANVHKFGKVPAIKYEGNTIIESIGIIRYLCGKFPYEDHWYPKDIQKQAKIDEFLEWQHIGLRVPLSMFFQTKFIRPLLSGSPPKESHVKMWEEKMEESLDLMEKVWLQNSPYLTGANISVADLVGICEVEQPRMAGYDPTKGRPNLTAWMDRVRLETQPHYNDVTKIVNMVIQKYKGVPPASPSEL